MFGRGPCVSGASGVDPSGSDLLIPGEGCIRCQFREKGSLPGERQGTGISSIVLKTGVCFLRTVDQLHHCPDVLDS